MSASTASAGLARHLCQHHVIVQGKVQGVFYRKYTQKAASELGVTGWVRNLSNGTVELVAEGTSSQLKQLEAWCHTGSPKSKVTAVLVTDITPAPPGDDPREKHTVPTRQFSTFDVRH